MINHLCIVRFSIFIAALGFSVLTTAQNLIKNGQFLEGATHWTVLTAGTDLPAPAQVIECSNDYATYGLGDNYVRTSFVELDATSAVQQELSTQPGEQHLLTFAYGHRPGSGKKKLVVLIGQEVVYTTTLDNSDAVGSFSYKTVHFTPSTASSTIGFYAVSLSGPEDQGILLTDVSCELDAAINLMDIMSTK